MSDFDETTWWGDCANTYHEEQKQIVAATRMGLIPNWACAHPPIFDLEGRSVVDIGGGPVSLLLKCVNRGKCDVLDPIIPRLHHWVGQRYFDLDIGVIAEPAENVGTTTSLPPYDEAWMYNVLQHVDDPATVVGNARALARTIRIFEWIDIEPYPGHPHMLTRDLLDRWLGGMGFSAHLDESGAVGHAYYGVFDLRAQ